MRNVPKRYSATNDFVQKNYKLYLDCEKRTLQQKILDFSKKQFLVTCISEIAFEQLVNLI
jgi:hypothetical protein